MNGMIWWADSPHPESYTKCPAFSLMETPRAPELRGNAVLCPGSQLVISNAFFVILKKMTNVFIDDNAQSKYTIIAIFYTN